MEQRTPRELIEIYWNRVYNNAEVELIRTVCADPIIRHDPNFVTALSHDEQIERVRRSLAIKPHFSHRVLHSDDTFVTSVWNMVSRDGRNIELCGIEVFEAHDGRFTRCWNSSYMKGLWGEEGDEFDPAVLTAPTLVTAPAEINADWYQRALAAGGKIMPQRLAMEPEVTSIGHGTTSQVVKIRATYNAGKITAPSTAICKIGRQSTEVLATVSPFERELRAYELFGDQAPFRIPQLYFGARMDGGICNLLMEDLSETASAGDQIAGCTIDEAYCVIRELAKFHREFWNRHDVLQLDWLSQPRKLLPSYDKGARVIEAWLADKLSEGVLDTIRQFGDSAERWLDIETDHPTLIHQDPRIDNVLFEQTAGGPRACLIDWQSLGKGDSQYDVAYFLTGSLSVEDRRSVERELIAEHARLINEVDSTYGLDEAMDGYRRNIGSGLWFTTIAAAFAERSEHNAQLISTLAARNVAAMNDWDWRSAIE